ncbi:SRPBCC family protein [Domibacillus tundrae]|uniref:SRPBCC family protein n=1 Tax=Domibacillus tundrae TaxID=1587527 RepID=UPI003390E5CD
MAGNTTMNVNENELVIKRIFDAPRELVFKAWTEPEHLNHWWAPQGFTMNSSKLDLVPDGVFHYSQRTPDGQVMWGKFVYREIVVPEKLVFINSFSDEEGNTTRAPFSPTWPLEILNILTLSEHHGKTTLLIQGGPLSASEEESKTFEAAREGVQQGFAETFDRLAHHLAKNWLC